MMNQPAFLCFLIFFGQVLPFFSSTPRPSIKPDDPFVFYGERLVLTCNLPSGNTSLAFFMVGNDNVTEEHQSRFNESTLVYEQTVSNTSEFNTGCNGKRVYCFDTKSEYAGQVVRADYKPESPQNISCVYLDEKIVICNWELKTPYSCPEYYAVDSFLNIHNGHLECAGTNNSCRTNVALNLGNVELLIRIRNDRANFTLETTTSFDMTALVKLEPVTNLTPSVTSRSLHLSWSHGRNPNKVTAHATLTALNGTNKGKKFSQSVSKASEMTVEGLHPAVAYRVSVVVRLSRGGVWSDDAVVDRFTTLSDAPDCGPPSTPGAYSQTSNSCSRDPTSTRNVTVFWKELPEEKQNGEITEYIIEYFPKDRTPGHSMRNVTVRSSQTQALLPGLQCDLEYTVHIYAFNTKRSVNFTEITIPPPDSVAPVDQLLIRLSSNGVRGQWKINSPQESFTLFWCKGRRISPCSEGPINWKTFPGNQREGNIPQVPSAISQAYTFGISSSTKQGSSGIMWQECFHRDYAEPSSPPQEVKLTNETDAVEVRWRAESCIETQDPVYVDAYRIRWCLASNFRNSKCSSDEGKLPVSSKFGNARLKGLQPEHDYMVVVEARTLDGKYGPASKPLPASLRLSATGPGTGYIIGVIIATLGAILAIAVVIIIVVRKWRTMSANMDVKMPDDPKRQNFPHDGFNNPGLVDDDDDAAIPEIPQAKFGTQLSNDSGMWSQNGSTSGDADSSEGDKNSPKAPSKVDDGSYIEAGLDHTICNGHGLGQGGGIVNFVTAPETTGHLPRSVLNVTKEGRHHQLAPVLETDIDEVMAPTTPTPIPGSPAGALPAGPGWPAAGSLQGTHVAAANGPKPPTSEVREGGSVLASQFREGGVEHATSQTGKGGISLAVQGVQYTAYSNPPPPPTQRCLHTQSMSPGDCSQAAPSPSQAAPSLSQAPPSLNQAAPSPCQAAPSPSTGNYKSQNDVANIMRTTAQQLAEPLRATEGNNTTAPNPSTGNYLSQSDVANIMGATTQQLAKPLQTTEGNSTRPIPSTGNYMSERDVANTMGASTQQLTEPLQATEGTNTTAFNLSTGNYMSQSDVANIMRATTQHLAEPLQATEGNNTAAPNPSTGNYVSQSDVANIMRATTQQLAEPRQATEGNNTATPNPGTGNYVSQNDVANIMGATTQQLAEPRQATEGNNTAAPNPSTGNYVSQNDVANMGATTQQLEEPL